MRSGLRRSLRSSDFLRFSAVSAGSLVSGILGSTSVKAGTTTPNVYTWTNSSSVWLAAANWNGNTTHAGTDGNAGNASNGNSGDVANLTQAGACSTLGINMNVGQGLMSLGAINLTSGITSTITNSSGALAGILQLNGDAGNFVGLGTNLLVNVGNATAGNLSIGNATTLASGFLTLNLGTTNGVINVVGSSRTLTINANITAATPATTSITLTGTGRLVLNGCGSFGGGIFLNGGPTPGSALGTSGNAALSIGHVDAAGTGAITIGAVEGLRAIEFNVGTATTFGTIQNDILFPTSGVTTLGLQGRSNTTNVNLSGKISGGLAGLTIYVDNAATASIATIRITGATNDFIGNLYLNRGNIAITNDAALGDITNTLILSINDATNPRGLRFDANNIVSHRNYALDADSSILLNGDNNGDGVVETSNDATIAGNLTSLVGSLNLRIAGGSQSGGNSAGSLRLTGNNTSFTSAMLVSTDVKVILASQFAMGCSSTTNTLGYVINGGGTLAFDGGTPGLAFNGGPNRNNSVTGQGVLKDGLAVGAIENLAGNNTYGGRFALAGDTSFGATAGNLTLGGNISGSFSLTKVGPGGITLSGANSNYTGGTVVQAGTLTVGSAFGLPAGGNVTLAGGTLATAGISSGAALGNLNVAAAANIALAAGNHTLLFTGLDPASTALTISGWTGIAEASGTGGKIVFTSLNSLPTDPNTTYASFLSTTSFSGFATGASFVASGANYELVPIVPEPGMVLTIATAALGLVGWARRRRNSSVNTDAVTLRP